MKVPLRELLITIIIALIIFAVVQTTLQSYRVEGRSMKPSFSNGQYLLVAKVLYRFGSPQRGDVIIFHPPISSTRPYIKRVIGLPGERVEIKEGKVYINDRELEETPDFYTPGNCLQILEEDEYFVLGDNRNASRDSHMGWTVPQDDILGKACLSIWPLDRLGFMPDYAYADE